MEDTRINSKEVSGFFDRQINYFEEEKRTLLYLLIYGCQKYFSDRGR
jgi:hypothetical protein